MLAAVVLLLALLRPSLSDDYLSFLDSREVGEFGDILNAREAVNKLIAIGAACAKEEEAIRGQYDDEERDVLKQYAEVVKEVGSSADEAYERLVTDLLEAEEGDVERVRVACVVHQREYLNGMVQAVLAYYSFLLKEDPTAATTFLTQADSYWESIRVGLDECRQLFAKESLGMPPEVFSEEKMCRTDEVELLLEAFQSFVEQAAMMEGKSEDSPLEGYLPGILPVIPDSDDDGSQPPVDPVESTNGPTDIEDYLPGILPVIPDNRQGSKVTGEPTEESKEEPTDESKEEPTEESKEEATEESKEEATEESKEEPTKESKEEPTEVSDGLKDLEAYLPGILPVIPDWSDPVDDMETSHTPATDNGQGNKDGGEATEEMKKATEEMKKPTEEMKKPTEEMKKPTEEMKKATEEMKKPTEEMKKPTEEMKKATEEMKKPTEEMKKPTEEMKATTRGPAADGLVDEVFDLQDEKAGSDSTPPEDTPTSSSQLHRSSSVLPPAAEGDGEAEEAMHLVIWTCVAAVAMVMLALVGVCVLALLVRHQRSRLVRQEPPLLKEKRQLSLMKEMGYINPTYRFHELQESKDSAYY